MDIMTARHLNATYKDSVAQIPQSHAFLEDDIHALATLK